MRVILFIYLISSSFVFAENFNSDLTELSFSELEDVVTSVSKRPEKAFTANAAIFVINQEDIKNSGLRSLPEILRLAPGLQVTRVDSKSWAITSRGFNADGFGNKLLVLIDGRSVYTPLFSGVYWDAQDTFIDDIERIEVIRGPGASLWGANAVNGVINVITKNSKNTQTNIINVGYGKENSEFIEARKGGKIDDNLFYRFYAKRFNTDASKDINGGSGGNSWYSNRSGYRVDWNKDSRNIFTFHGDVYYNNEELDLYLPNSTFLDDRFEVSGINFVNKWSHSHDNGSNSRLQLYYDLASADYSVLHQNNHTIDLEYQNTVDVKNHKFISGLGYRYIYDELDGSEFLSYQPNTRGRNLFSFFLQDSMAILDGKVNLTIGSKIEHNDFTGFEFQPTIRANYVINENSNIWGAVSRAVRTPNRSEDDISLVILPGYIRWVGNDDFKSEDLVAYEVGYRFKSNDRFKIDTTAFYNTYSNIRTNEVSGQTLPSDTVLGLEFDNKAKANSFGVEIFGELELTKYWKLNASYTYLNLDIDKFADSTDIVVESEELLSPKHQFQIRSQLYLPSSIEIGNSLYYVDRLQAINVPSYFRFDSRILWRIKPGYELSLVGQNLFDSTHREFSQPLHGIESEIERNVYAKFTYRF